MYLFKFHTNFFNETFFFFLKKEESQAYFIYYRFIQVGEFDIY